MAVRETLLRSFLSKNTLMSRIERRYCSASTLFMTGLLAIFILLHI